MPQDTKKEHWPAANKQLRVVQTDARASLVSLREDAASEDARASAKAVMKRLAAERALWMRRWSGCSITVRHLEKLRPRNRSERRHATSATAVAEKQHAVWMAAQEAAMDACRSLGSLNYDICALVFPEEVAQVHEALDALPG